MIGRESQALEDIMKKLRIKYSEMYTIVPAEIETQLEDCKKVLQDLEEKVGVDVVFMFIYLQCINTAVFDEYHSSKFQLETSIIFVCIFFSVKIYV